MSEIRRGFAWRAALALAIAAVVLMPASSALGAALVPGSWGPGVRALASLAPTISGDGMDSRVRAAALRVALQPRHQRSSSAHARQTSAVLVRIPHDLAITSRPGGGKTVGVMPSRSKYLGTPTTAWVLDVTRDGRFGRVVVPYRAGGATGWMRLAGLTRSTTRYEIRVDLARHQLTVLRLDRVILRVAAGSGAPWSPTPPGRYFVTDLVPVHVGSAFGSFAFGLSGVQPNLPRGWTGGNQLAIHGTNRPSTIGASASAGCIHVSESTLARLRQLVVLGTPVVIVR